jgi:hypothetical protein
LARRDVSRAVRGQISTAAKIRTLAAQGRSRADIARALGIRYQHVRNVLFREEAKARAGEASDPTAIASKIQISSDRTAIVPAKVIDALALKPGDVLFARMESDEIHLLTKTAVIPEGVSLVDELIEDRRREVEAEAEDV